MICRFCRKGGEWNAAWKADRKDHYLQQAIEAHGWCKGCPCQHAVGVDSLRYSPQ